MKKLLIISAFFLAYNCNILLGQTIAQAHDYNDFDPIEHYKFVEKLNKSNLSTNLRNAKKIKIDSVTYYDSPDPSGRIFFDFNVANNNETSFYYFYRGGGFDANSYFELEYDSKNLLTQINYTKPWDGNLNVPGENEVTWIRKATYDRDDKVKLYSYYLPTEDGGEFLLSTYDHLYNSDGKLSELLYYSYEDGGLKLQDHTYYHYEKDLLKEVIDKTKNEDELWVTQDSTVYQYYPNLNLKSITNYYGKDIGRNDNFNITYLYEYNNENQLVGDHVYRNSEYDDGELRITRFITYNNYDPLGNLILSTNYTSFTLTDSIISSEEYYTYNLDFTSAETQFPKPNAFYFNQDILDRSPVYPIKTYERYGYEQGENPGLEDREEYFYSDIKTSTQEDLVTQLSISIFPNPAGDFVQVHFDNNSLPCDISITDVNGKRVVDVQDYRSGHDIDVAELEAGVYFYQVKHKDGQASGQFVKCSY